MTIRRAPRPRTHYTVVSNAVLEDGRLSFKAAGVLVYLLSKPDHWEVSREHLAGTHTDGVDSIRTALRELRAAGYITDDVDRDDQGRIIGKSLVVHDSPQAGAPHGGKPPRRPMPQVDDPALVSTDLQQGRTEATPETPPTPPAAVSPTQGQLVPAADARPVAGRTYASARPHDLVFERFWQVYPRKVGKLAARRAWDKALRLAPDDVIIAGAERYANDVNRDPEYTAHPSTWLNRGGWDDEPLPARSGRNDANRTERAIARLAGGRVPKPDLAAVFGQQPARGELGA